MAAISAAICYGNQIAVARDYFPDQEVMTSSIWDAFLRWRASRSVSAGTVRSQRAGHAWLFGKLILYSSVAFTRMAELSAALDPRLDPRLVADGAGAADGADASAAASGSGIPILAIMAEASANIPALEEAMAAMAPALQACVSPFDIMLVLDEAFQLGAGDPACLASIPARLRMHSVAEDQAVAERKAKEAEAERFRKAKEAEMRQQRQASGKSAASGYSLDTSSLGGFLSSALGAATTLATNTASSLLGRESPSALPEGHGISEEELERMRQNSRSGRAGAGRPKPSEGRQPSGKFEGIGHKAESDSDEGESGRVGSAGGSRGFGGFGGFGGLGGAGGADAAERCDLSPEDEGAGRRAGTGRDAGYGRGHGRSGSRGAESDVDLDVEEAPVAVGSSGGRREAGKKFSTPAEGEGREAREERRAAGHKTVALKKRGKKTLK